MVVKRFDRQWQTQPEWIVRVPQEDFCQVLGHASAHKYEDQGGPGMDDCLRVLKGSARYAEDGRVFLLAQLAFWLLAACFRFPACARCRAPNEANDYSTTFGSLARAGRPTR